MKKKTIVLSGVGFGAVAIAALVVAFVNWNAAGRGANYSVETNYIFQLADKNRDGTVSRDEANGFEQARRALVESNGRLEFSPETGELRESDRFANDEAAREEFMKRTAIKNASEHE